MKYPQDFINKIICGDILKAIKQIPDETVDLVVTSPPYNLKNSSGNGMKDGRGGKWANAALQKGYSHHNDCMPHHEYGEMATSPPCATGTSAQRKNTNF